MADCFGQPHDDLKMPVAFKHDASIPPADCRADNLLHRREAEASPGDLSLVDRDVQNRQAAGLLDFDVGGALGGPQDARDLVGGAQQGLKLVAKDLDRDIARTPASSSLKRIWMGWVNS